MVDPIGLKPIPTSDRKVVSAPRIAAPTMVGTPETVATVVTTAQELAAAPPVDYDRIARIRQAIADGNFPIAPAQIADRLIAAKFEWARNE